MCRNVCLTFDPDLSQNILTCCVGEARGPNTEKPVGCYIWSLEAKILSWENTKQRNRLFEFCIKIGRAK